MFDKFNIINKISNDNKNYSSIIKNYIENYFDSNINIYHPDYLYQIVWNNKIDNNELLILYNISIEKYLIQKKQDIRNLIKKDKFNLQSLNKLINLLNLQISKLLNILNLNINIKKNFLIKLLSEPIIINFIQLELTNFDEESINEIKELCFKMNNLSNDYVWFLKLIGKTLKNNIISFEFNIPNKYNKLYEIYYIFDNINEIKKKYNFIDDSLNLVHIINPTYEIFKNKFIEVINFCSINNLYNLINLKIIELFNGDIQFINNVKSSISLYLRNNLDVNINFMKLIILCNNLKLLENYILVFFEEENIINNLFVIINNCIRKIDKIRFIKDIILLLTNIKIKDVFLNKYHELLIKRLLSREININNEITVLNTLKLYFNHNIVNKINKVLNDYIVSTQDLDFYNNKYNIQNINILTTSYLNWNINYNEGYVNSLTECKNTSNNDLKSYIINYQEYYNKIYIDKRKLQWLLQYGEINITYNNINITLLPIQLLVLELFNDNISLLINDILSQEFFDNYSNKFKNNIINSLLNSKILKLENDKVYLSESNDIETNLINISCDYIQDIRESFIDELANSREDIIKCIINHYIKIKPINKEELYLLVENDIKYFKLTQDLFDKAINYLLKFDYLEIKDNKINQCLY